MSTETILPKGRRRSRDLKAIKTEAVLLRMRPEEKALFERAAIAADLHLNVWMRDRLAKLAAQELRLRELADSLEPC